MTPSAQQPAASEAALAAREKTQALLADLWRRNRPVIEERLAILDRAAAVPGPVPGPMPEDLRAAALEVAHKLSGSLGMFGFHEGTRIARELEQLLGDPQPDPTLLAHLAKQLREMLLPSD